MQVYRSQNVVTALVKEGRRRNLAQYQFILRLYDYPDQILGGFDLPCCSIGYSPTLGASAVLALSSLSYLFLSCLVLSILSCLVMSCLVGLGLAWLVFLSCLVLLCIILSFLVLSYFFLSFLFGLVFFVLPCLFCLVLSCWPCLVLHFVLSCPVFAGLVFLVLLVSILSCPCEL